MIVGILMLFSACSVRSGEDRSSDPSEALDGHAFLGSMPLSWARSYSVDRYEDGYDLIRVSDGRTYLAVPEGGTVPEGLEDEVIVLQKPLNNIAAVSSAAMDPFLKLDSLEKVAFAGLPAKQWYLPEVKEAMESGAVRYCGKYSAPDYEQLRSSRCSLAVENMMIYHVPEVMEQLESLGIPVFVDCSSNEQSPLGRLEWIRLYGILTDREEEARQWMEEQSRVFGDLEALPETGKTVAFFSINASGEAIVRTGADYIAAMIGTAGGQYVFSDLRPSGKTISATESIAMEQFYKTAKNADILIVNASLSVGCRTIEELKGTSPMFQNMKAVRNGQVFLAEENLYQSSMELGTVTMEMHELFAGQLTEGRFFRRMA